MHKSHAENNSIALVGSVCRAWNCHLISCSSAKQRVISGISLSKIIKLLLIGLSCSISTAVTAQHHLQIWCRNTASVQEQSSSADSINKIGALDLDSLSYISKRKTWINIATTSHKHQHLLMQWANIQAAQGCI